MSKECENCIKRKTMWCPTSIDCLALDELPYHLDKVSALEKIDNLQQENKQLKEENARLKLKPLEGVFAQVDDDMLLRSCGAMQQEIDNYKYILAELEKDLWAVRRLTFTKYYSNEWNNCLSFNEDILPIINKIQKLKEKYK